jgi:uncharacterized FlaG/YvyC family protein
VIISNEQRPTFAPGVDYDVMRLVRHLNSSIKGGSREVFFVKDDETGRILVCIIDRTASEIIVVAKLDTVNSGVIVGHDELAFRPYGDAIVRRTTGKVLSPVPRDYALRLARRLRINDSAVADLTAGAAS